MGSAAVLLGAGLDGVLDYWQRGTRLVHDAPTPCGNFAFSHLAPGGPAWLRWLHAAAHFRQPTQAAAAQGHAVGMWCQNGGQRLKPQMGEKREGSMAPNRDEQGCGWDCTAYGSHVSQPNPRARTTHARGRRARMPVHGRLVPDRKHQQLPCCANAQLLCDPAWETPAAPFPAAVCSGSSTACTVAVCCCSPLP